VHQVGNQYIVNSWCTVRKTSSYVEENILWIKNILWIN